MAYFRLLFLWGMSSLNPPTGAVQLPTSFGYYSAPAFTGDFTAPAMEAQQFLIVSSPSEKKVAWTTLLNFESKEGRPFPLIDSGLVEPRGISYDRKRGHLYVADSGAQKIFRYTIVPVISGVSTSLVTTGVRMTISQGHPVDAVTITDSGDLFYTAPDTNNINKIPAKVMAKISNGQVTAAALQIISQKTLQFQETMAARVLAMNQAKTAAEKSRALPVDPTPPQPNILSIYEGSLNPHVSLPTALLADGQDLYWANKQSGTTAGTVVKGASHPKSVASSSGPSAFPALALSNVSEAAFGIGKTEQILFFTRTGVAANTGVVSALLLGSDIMIDVSKDLQAPRGLIWDRDDTMYVADETLGNVWSFPCGRMMSNIPLTKALHMDGAHSLALVSSSDPAFLANEVEPGGLSHDGVAPATGLDEADQVFLIDTASKFGAANYMKKSRSHRGAAMSALTVLATVVSGAVLLH